MGVAGPVLFSRYAFPPNDLGHCGPPGAEDLLAGGSAVFDADFRSRAACFDGAWPYLELLARTAGVDDPLDPAVVSAYWRGGALLDQVPRDDFEQTVITSFGGQPGVLDRLRRAPEVLEAGPSHAFHVFVVYPWIGLLHSGGDVARTVLDNCRVRWGTVQWVDGDSAGVTSPPLTWDGAKLGLGPAQLEVRRWSRGGHAFVTGLQPGDVVSLHWDWISDRLTSAEASVLAGTAHHQLTLINPLLFG